MSAGSEAVRKEEERSRVEVCDAEVVTALCPNSPCVDLAFFANLEEHPTVGTVPFRRASWHVGQADAFKMEPLQFAVLWIESIMFQTVT
jgi:hypothetical protein